MFILCPAWVDGIDVVEQSLMPPAATSDALDVEQPVLLGPVPPLFNDGHIGGRFLPTPRYMFRTRGSFWTGLLQSQL